METKFSVSLAKKKMREIVYQVEGTRGQWRYFGFFFEVNMHVQN